jgi:hypothetical protein
MTTELLKLQPNDTNARANQIVLDNFLKNGGSSIDSSNSTLKSLEVGSKLKKDTLSLPFFSASQN